MIDEIGSVMFGDRLCISNDVELRREILEEANFSNYTIHLGSTKMYRDFKGIFWWKNM